MEDMSGKVLDLYDFLVEAELQHYYTAIKSELKVQNVAQLKYATDEDLRLLGCSRPEIRRLRKFYDRHYPNGYLSKIKRLLHAPNKKDEAGQLSTVNEERSNSISRNSTTSNNSNTSNAPGSKHIIPAESINVHKQLGIGEFGVVQQGVWKNNGENIQVAIKCLSRERMQSHPMEFLKEAAIMHSVENPHIVRLYGVVLDTDALMLVTELAPLRSLLECLKEPALRSSFTISTLCEFASQICIGMNYLENKRLIHRDLAARNILVFSKYKVKISDFGLSRALGVGKDYYQTNFNVNLKLPIAWCAPECISYLRFTSASDVWAYAVTLWEMFSYGFQPWAALTGHQILEAIDEPNYQRLEQPECCPKEYYSLMMKCWQHDPLNRPSFAEILSFLPECKPERVQAIVNTVSNMNANCNMGIIADKKNNRDRLQYRAGDVITVLDKVNHLPLWRGVLDSSGRGGLFDPATTVTYVGPLPNSGSLGSSVGGTINQGVCRQQSGGRNNNNGAFHRASFSADRNSKRRLRTEMISSPQGDLKHTSHVGLDGAYFGDVTFLRAIGNSNPGAGDSIISNNGLSPSVPRQIVAPYKPSEDLDEQPLLPPSDGGCHTTVDGGSDVVGGRARPQVANLNLNLNLDLRKEFGEVNGRKVKWTNDDNDFVDNNAEPHEYHEISDDENVISDSPRFEKSFDLGPSLLDEMESMFRSLGSPKPPPSPAVDHDGVNQRNEIMELSNRLSRTASTGKKKQASVKPISASDERALDCAIAMANEISARSMTDLESHNGTLDGSSHLSRQQGSPHCSARKKFSFRFPTPGHSNSQNSGSGGSGHHQGNTQGGSGHQDSLNRTGGNFYQEAQSIPDLQSTITEETRLAYNSLIEQPVANRCLTALNGAGAGVQSATLPVNQVAPVQLQTTGPSPASMTSVLQSGPPVTMAPVINALHHHHDDGLNSPTDDTNPLRILKSSKNFPAVRPRVKYMGTDKLRTLPNIRRHIDDVNSGDATSNCGDDVSVPESPSYVTTTSYGGGFSYPDDPSDPHPPTSHQVSNNLVPLPPKDRSLTALSNRNAAKRHTRKHPLVILPATSGVQRTLDKVNQITPVEDRPPVTFPPQVQRVSPTRIVSTQVIRPVSPSYVNQCDVVDYARNKHGKEVLENNFTKEELQKLKQVEYENIVSSDKDQTKEPHLPVVNQIPACTKPIVLPRRHQSLTDVPNSQDVDRASMDFENLVESDFNFETDDAFYEPGENPVDEIDTPASGVSRPRLASADAAVSVTIPGVNLDKNTVTEHDVSCEDLLDFAGRKPPGRARGVESDEVRIMNKVLGKEMTPEACLVALEHMDWDVHRAIKLARLRLLLNNTSSNNINSELKTVIDNLGNKDLVGALDTTSWDVTKAACWLYETHSS